MMTHKYWWPNTSICMESVWLLISMWERLNQTCIHRFLQASICVRKGGMKKNIWVRTSEHGWCWPQHLLHIIYLHNVLHEDDLCEWWSLTLFPAGILEYKYELHSTEQVQIFQNLFAYAIRWPENSEWAWLLCHFGLSLFCQRHV